MFSRQNATKFVPGKNLVTAAPFQRTNRMRKIGLFEAFIIIFIHDLAVGNIKTNHVSVHPAIIAEEQEDGDVINPTYRQN